MKGNSRMDGKESVRVSGLGKTWLLDIDGTIVKHNGYKTDGYDTLLPGAAEYLSAIPESDMIVFITSRGKEYSGMTERFLRDNGIRFDAVLYGAPYGERILVNDRKPSGLETALAVNTERDVFGIPRIEIDGAL